MGGSFDFFVSYVQALIAVLVLALPFVLAAALRVVVGPRERLVVRGLKCVGFMLGLGTLGIAVMKASADPLRRLGGYQFSVVVTALVVVLVAVGMVGVIKGVAETTWARALGSLGLTGAVYAGLFWTLS